MGTALGNLGSPMFLSTSSFGALLTLVAGAHHVSYRSALVALGRAGGGQRLGVAAMLALVLDLPFWASAVWVGTGEAAVMFTCGLALLLLVRRRRDAVRTDTTGRLRRP